MIYVITNGEQYIRTNPNGRLAWSGNPTLANSFETFPAALGFLKTKRVQNFLKGSSKRSRVVELTDGYVPIEKPEDCGEENLNDVDDIKSMDIDRLLKTPHLPDEYNPYTYYGDVELDLENIANVLQSANKILSNLDRYYESIKYLEREMDLRIFDVRHTLVEDETKLSGVAMQRLINSTISSVKNGAVMDIKRVGNLTRHRLTGGTPQYLCLKWWHGYFFV